MVFLLRVFPRSSASYFQDRLCASRTRDALILFICVQSQRLHHRSFFFCEASGAIQLDAKTSCRLSYPYDQTLTDQNSPSAQECGQFQRQRLIQVGIQTDGLHIVDSDQDHRVQTGTSMRQIRCSKKDNDRPVMPQEINEAFQRCILELKSMVAHADRKSVV